MSDSVSHHAATPVPESVARAAHLMSTFRGTWVLCGGWAVDAWLGRQTRDHGDIDVTVFEDEQRALFDHLAGWHLIADDSSVDTHKPWNGRELTLPAHIHCAAPESGFDQAELAATGAARAQDGFNLEVYVNERSGDDWVLNGEPPVSVPVDQCTRQSGWGLPTLAPEVIVFYKATAYFGLEEYEGRRPQDEPDFLALLPHISEERRDWLRETISSVKPDHPWLSKLS